jgi:invasion protein IalB
MVSASTIARIIVAVALVSAAGASSLALQQHSPSPAAKQPAGGEAGGETKVTVRPGAGWASKCESQSRQTAMECYVEQTVVMAQTGRLLVSARIRVPPDTRQPVMTIQVPLGLYLPGGLDLQVDDEKPQDLAVETCDLKGCFAGMVVPKEMLAAMKTGKVFKVTLENLTKEKISVPLPLTNFARAYKNIQ